AASRGDDERVHEFLLSSAPLYRSGRGPREPARPETLRRSRAAASISVALAAVGDTPTADARRSYSWSHSLRSGIPRPWTLVAPTMLAHAGPRRRSSDDRRVGRARRTGVTTRRRGGAARGGHRPVPRALRS